MSIMILHDARADETLALVWVLVPVPVLVLVLVLAVLDIFSGELCHRFIDGTASCIAAEE
jgi:hypothetical protein